MITRRNASVLLAACFVLDVRSACGTIRHVPADYGTIQQAVDAAAEGDTVEVACGTYYEHDIVVSKRIFLTSETGLSGCVTVDAEQEGPVFSTPLASIAIRGFTIRGGSAERGAGIYCLASQLTLERCLFEDNSATQDGGGVYCNQGYVIATDCWFEGNTASAGGGAFIVYGGAAFVGCTFTGNSASGANHPHDGGGAVATGPGFGQSAEFDNCVFTENSAPLGGAIYCDYETNTPLRHCVVSGNTANAGGGLFGTPYSGSFTIEFTAVTGNVAIGKGGGAFTGGSSIFRNSTIAGNTAGAGGGVAAYWVCNFENSVLSGNCGTDGDELYVNAEFPASRARFSCSVVDSSAGWLAVGLGAGGTVEWLGSNKFTDPLFCGPLACDLGAPIGGDYSVAAGSPCLPENSDGCDLIGCYGLGSCTTAVEARTWGRVKALFR